MVITSLNVSVVGVKESVNLFVTSGVVFNIKDVGVYDTVGVDDTVEVDDTVYDKVVDSVDDIVVEDVVMVEDVVVNVVVHPGPKSKFPEMLYNLLNIYSKNYSNHIRHHSLYHN